MMTQRYPHAYLRGDALTLVLTFMITDIPLVFFSLAVGAGDRASLSEDPVLIGRYSV